MQTTNITQRNSEGILYNVSKLSPRSKLFVSILFGVASLVLSPYGISAKMGEIVINVPWTILFPILVSMAFGWRYGLIASLAGAAFFPFLLWPNNGWASLMDSIIFMAFFSSIGLVNGMQIKVGKPVLFYRITLIFLLFIMVSAVEDLILFNKWLSMNPPFWHQTTINHLDYSILKSILVKDSINIVFFTLIAETLLCLPTIRLLFGLEAKSYMRVNNRIFVSVILSSILLWVMYFGLDSSLLQNHQGLHDGHIPLTLFVIVIGGFTSSRFIIYYTERQLLTKDLLTESETNLKLQFNRMPVACIIWGTDYTIKDWNPAAEKIFGYSYDDVLGKKANVTIVPKNIKPHISQIWNALLKEGIDKQSINENLTKDGRTILCDWANTPLKDNLGKVTGVISMVKDITEGKKTEDALQFLANRGWSAATEDFFNSLAKYLGRSLGLDYALIAKLNETGETVETIALYANGALAPNITFKLNGTPCENVVGKEMRIYQQKIQSLFPLDTLLRDMQAESYMGMPLWDSKGRPIGLIAVIDKKPLENIPIITSIFNIFAISASAEIERKLSEDALRESEEKYRGLVENSPDAIAIYVEGKIVFVNNECLRLMAATSKAELIGKSVIQLVHPDYREFVIERMKKAATEDTILPLVEEKFLRLDGIEVDVEVKALPIRFENKQAVQLIVRDITERKLAEESLKLSEERFRLILENMPILLNAFDEKGNIIVWNKACEVATGYMANEIIGNPKALELLYPDPIYRKQVWDSSLDSNQTENIYDLISKEGKLKTVHWFDIYHKLNIPGWVSWGLGQDITERIQADLALKENEKKFRNLIELAADGILIGSHEGIILDANSQFCFMIGSTRDKFIGQPIQSLPFTKESKKRAPFRFDLLQKGEIVLNERELIRPDGSSLIVEMRSKMMPDKTLQAIFTDITERKKAEVALRESEYFFKESQSAAFIGSYKTDFITGIWESSEILDQIFGIDKNYKRNVQGWLEIVHQDDREIMEHHLMEDVILNRKPFNKEYRITRKSDGMTRWVFGLGKADFDKEGNILSLIGTIQDVSERKLAEEALKISEERFKIVTESAEEWVWEVNNEGLYTYSNHVVEKILGYKPEEIVGFNYFFDFFDPDNKQFLKDSALTAFAQQIPFKDFENTNIHKNGQKVIFKTTGIPIINTSNKLIGYRGVDIDITERVQMELALKESEEKYRLTFYTSPDSVNINQMDGTYVDVNDGFTNMTGYTKENVKGKLSSEIEIWAIPDDRVKLVKGLKEKGMVTNLESIFRCKDGALKTGLMSARIVKINNVPHILSITRDITERVQMEMALKESEEKYRLTFLTSPDSVSISKMDGTFVDINDSFSKITGYSREEVIGKLSSEINLWVYPEERPQLVKSLLIDGIVNNFEWLSRKKDGTFSTGLMSAGIIKINNTPHILSIVRDITERKVLETAIKKSEEQFRLLFERSNNAIFLIDKRNGNYLDANKAAEQLTGYSVNELKKLNTARLTPEGAKNRLSKIANLKTTIDIGELEYVQPDQSKRYATLNVVPLNENTVFGIAHDITERKQFEAKLRILSRAIEQSPVSVVITDTDGKIEYVNPKFTQVTEYSNDEAVGENPRILKSGITSKEEYKNLWETIKRGKEWSGEFCNVKKSGEVYWESAVISPIINEKGVITHFVAVKEDITERKETDRKILSTIIETEERERNRFSRDLHDGLGPLLSTIKLYFQWLSETNDPDKTKIIVEKGNKNLNEAIESIRDISNNLSPRTLTTFGVEAAIKNFIGNLNQTQKLAIGFESNSTNRLDKNVEITLYRIVTELLNNTIKYANATQCEVKLLLDKKSEWITLTYNDNGIGFDLIKVQSSAKGFGLINIAQRVNMLNGKINIISSIGKGILVFIELPLGKK